MTAAMRFCGMGIVAAMSLGSRVRAQVPVDLLPDIITNPSYLEDTEVRTDIEPGRAFLTLSNATPNIGDGPLEVFAVPPIKDGDSQQQPVMQRIYRSDSTSYDRLAGNFVYHASHHHTHIEDWAIYRLRAVLPGDGVGPIVASGDKTSFCLLDSRVYNRDLPGAPEFPVYETCDNTLQGISVGYQDLYEKDLPDQWIDITDVPDGVYWLESEVDPDHHVLEKSEDNNVARVKVTLDRGFPAPALTQQGIIAMLIALFQRLLAFLQSLFGPR